MAIDQLLTKGDAGPNVTKLQELLVSHGLFPSQSGSFDLATQNAVRAFQAQNVDQHGQPLVVDGKVGPLTWWSLTHPAPLILPFSAVDFTKMPSEEAGGSPAGRRALEAAVAELNQGAGEQGGDDSGPWVRKYLGPAKLAEGNDWCAGFVSYCILQASNGNLAEMPVPYSPSARQLLNTFKKKGWAHNPESGYSPLPGDIVTWWRVRADHWKGHVGLVHQVKDGMLYTIEGNRSPNVQGFSYVLSRIDKLLGYGHVP